MFVSAIAGLNSLWCQTANISGVVNAYTPVLSFEPCNKVTVQSSAGFAAGQLVLLIQMQGATADVSNTAAAGDLLALNTAGNYEFARIHSVVGNTIQFKELLQRTYTPSGAVQLIRVPEYTNATVTGTLTAQPWNGSTGGVIVLDVANTLTLNAGMNASGMGFRGGQVLMNISPSNTGNFDFTLPDNSTEAARKGESIFILPGSAVCGGGKNVGGGGGGRNHNSGGGGAGNGGAGGIGGDDWFASLKNGGLGGATLPYSNAQNRLFMGSGGGSGHNNTACNGATSGGNGGGIIIIRANTIVGNNQVIEANGSQLPSTPECDGTGGGGAGGVIALSVTNYSGNLTLQAAGGAGGENTWIQAAGSAIGVGGGGGGGVVWSSTALPPAVTRIVGGGAAGRINNPASAWHLSTRNSQPGQTGLQLQGLILPQSNEPCLVEVNINPASVAICQGQNTTLTAVAPGANQFQWNTGATTASITVSPTTTTTYTVTATVNGTCPVTATRTVFVGTAPVANAGPNLMTCPNTPVQLGTPAQPGVSYQWFPATGLSNDNIAQPTATLATTRTYTLVAARPTGINQVFNGDFELGNVGFTSGYTYTPTGPNATMTYNIRNNTPWANCQDNTPDPGTLMFVADPAAPPGVADPERPLWCQTMTVTPNTNYRVSYFGAAANSNPPILQMRINNTPIDNVTLNLGQQCVWTQQFALWNSGANTSVSFCIHSLKPDAAGNDLALDDIAFEPVCADTSTVTVTVVTPTVSITPNPASFCAGGSVNLTATATDGWTNFSWNTGPNTAAITVSPTATTTYTVTARTAQNTCPVTATVTVTVNPNPTVQALASQNQICSNQSVTLTASGAATYTWQPGGQTGATFTTNPTTTTTYTVTGTSAAGCTGTATVTVTVVPPPVANAGPDQTICIGENVQLGAPPVNGLSYSWQGHSGLSNPSIANPTASPTTTTTYTLTVTQTVGGNLVNNGDFNSGTQTDPGFTTQYGLPPLSSNALVPEGRVAIVSNPRSVHPSFAQCTDHTTGNGRMLVVNGNVIPNQQVWCQTVNVLPNTTYDFSTWVGSVVASNPAVLQFSINGVLLNQPFTAPGQLCVWQQFSAQWNSGAATTAQICIVNQNTIAGGNDFMLDDIALVPVCMDMDEVTVTVHSNPTVTVTPSAPAICVGQSSTLTASGATTYVWSTTGLPNQTGASITVSPTATRTYTVTGTSGDGCTGTATVTVTVNPLPTITASADRNFVCVGNTLPVTITASGGSSFTWEPGTLTGGTILVNPTQTTTYTVTGTNASGCTNTATITIQVRDNPVVAVQAANPVICLGESTSLTATGAATYSWSTGGVGATITVSPTQTTTYIVVGTADNTCTATAEVTVTVVGLPVLAIQAAPSVVCRGQATTLSATGASTYTWQQGNLTGSAVVVSPTQNTIYTVTGVAGSGCTTTGIVEVEVLPLPTIIATTLTPQICENGTAFLNGSGGLTYTWQPGNLAGTTVAVQPNIPTTYTVTGTDGNGCTNTATVSVGFFTPPVVQIAGNPNVCLGQEVTLTASGGVEYVWSTGWALPQLTVSPTVQTTYSVLGTDANGCTSTAEFTVTPFAEPVFSIQVSEPVICIGDLTTLTASGGVVYLWELTGDTDPVITVNPTTTTTYVLFGIDANGCQGTAQATVTVNPLPNVTVVASDSEICTGFNTVLTASGAVQYEWFPIGQFSSSVVVTPTQTTTYTVQGTDANGCVAEAEITITVNPLPDLAIQTQTPEICIGSPAVLAASGAVTYLWQPGNLAGAVVTVSPTQTTTYTVQGTDANGCVNTSAFTLVVNPLPVMSVTGASAICIGQSADLTASGAVNYSWSPAGSLSASTGATVTATPTQTTAYTVTGTDANGCVNTTVFTLVVNPLPGVVITPAQTEICPGTSTTLTAFGATSYVWLNDNSTNATLTVSPTQTTTYTVQGTDGNGCVNTATATVAVRTLAPITFTGDSVLCFGQSTIITASGAVAYSWSNGQNGPNLILQAPPATATYTVAATDNLGCVQLIPITVVVNPLPDVQITGAPTVLCRNTSVVLTATGAQTYVWSTGATTPAINFSSNAPLTVSVIGTDANGCTNTAEVFLPVSDLAADAGPNSTFVTGLTVPLGPPNGQPGQLGTPPYSYQWIPSANLSCTSCPNPVASPVDPITSYTVVVTDANGCTATDDVTLTLIDVPPAPLQANAQTLVIGAICQDTKVWLWGDGIGGVFPYEYKWEPSTGLNDSILKNPFASPKTTIIYTLTVTDAIGQTATDVVQITVHPAMQVSAGPDHTICLGSAVQLGGSPVAQFGGAPYLYSWSPAVGLDDPTKPRPMASPTVTTDYILTVSDTFGCHKFDTVRVFVAAFPALSLSTAPTAVKCANQPVTVSTGVTGGSGQFAYQWTPTTGLTNPTAATTVANPAQTTTYTVRVLDSNGCVAIDSQKVVVSPPLLASFNQQTAVCFGTATQVSAAFIGGQPPYSYSWAPASAFINPFVATPSVIALQTQVFTLTVTDANGCSVSAQTHLPVHPQLSVHAGPDQVKCGEPTGQLAATVLGMNPIQVEWKPAFGLSNPFVLNPTVSVNQLVSYTLTATDANGCTASDVVVYKAGPPVAVELETEVSYCVGNGGAVLKPKATGGLGVYTYTWLPLTGLDLTNPARPVASPSQPTTYTLTVADGNGCAAQATITVTPLAFAGNQLTLGTAGKPHLCGADTLILRAEPANLPVYTWSTNGFTITGANGPTLTVTQPGAYYVSTTDGQGCRGGRSDSVVVTQSGPAEAPVLVKQGQGGAVAPATDTYTYTWYRNGVKVTDTSAFLISPLQNGEWYVILTDAAGCRFKSNTIVIGSGTTAVEGAVGSSIRIYPNPSNGIAHLEIRGIQGIVRLAVYDVVGKTIASRVHRVSSDIERLTLPQNLTTGVYTVSLTDESGSTFVEKLVVH
jgi:hypothetical protein